MQSFNDALAYGFERTPKHIPPKYLYDERGSLLFDAITRVAAYYLTRAELEILETYEAAIAARIGEDVDLVELGSGSSAKTRALFKALKRVGLYVPVDIAKEQLDTAVASLRQAYPDLAMQPLCADFTADFTVPERRPGAKMVAYFPGSTLGNFEPKGAVELLARLRTLVGEGGGLLLGVDLKKDPALIHRAYNDDDGITAAFNSNVLVRANRELGWNFCLEQFSHYASYDPMQGRVAMTLVSTARQSARCGELAVDLALGEPIVTEYSYKFTLPELEALADAAGFQLLDAWRDDRRYFAVAYLQA